MTEEKPKSGFVGESDINDADYRSSYINSFGNKVRIYKDAVEIIIKKRVFHVQYSDLTRVAFTDDMKSDRPTLKFITNSSEITFVADTKSGLERDVIKLGRLLQRRVTSSRRG
jgi:hypothetical protein